MMYQDLFGLERLPFHNTPDPHFFYKDAGRSDTLSALLDAVKNGDGLAVVSGEAGCGKTMICRLLHQKLVNDHVVIVLNDPSLPADSMPAAIAMELSLDIEWDHCRTQAMHSLKAYLDERAEANQKVVLLIEEAQGLTDEGLEKIRLLSNLESNDQKLLQIVLFGQPSLESRLQSHELNSRIAHHYSLKGLNLKQLETYLDFRLRQAGYMSANVFIGRACKEMLRHTRGQPRQINHLAHKTLKRIATIGASQITPRHIRDAHHDRPIKTANKGFSITALPGMEQLWKPMAATSLTALMLAAGSMWWFNQDELSFAQQPAVEQQVQVVDQKAIKPVQSQQVTPVITITKTVKTAPNTSLIKDIDSGMPASETALSAVDGSVTSVTESTPTTLINTQAVLKPASISPEKKQWHKDITTATYQPAAAPVRLTKAPTQKAKQIKAVAKTVHSETNKSTSKKTTRAVHVVKKSVSTTPVPYKTPEVSSIASLPDGEFLAQRLTATGQWISKADDNHFSVRLMVLEEGRSPQEIKTFFKQVASNLDEDQLQMFQLRNGNLLVSYGDFSTYTEGEMVVSQLTPLLRRFHPEIQVISNLREDLYRADLTEDGFKTFSQEVKAFGRHALRYSIQVGAFFEKSRADQFISSLTENGMDPYRLEIQDSKGQIWHTVHVGRYVDYESAKAEAEPMKKKLGAYVFPLHSFVSGLWWKNQIKLPSETSTMAKQENETPEAG
ncbi:MAG: AAA family ATPase [Magnetococcales bacterium]|nr:AAA family ATPase [Magnetococcales bacterium]